MQFSTVIKSALLILFANTACGAAVPVVDMANIGSRLKAGVPMTFTGSLVPGGPKVNFTGTVLDVIPKIKKLYPNWKPDLKPSTSPNPAKRYFKGKPFCSVGPRGDRYTALYHGVPYLKALGGLKYRILFHRAPTSIEG
ncbi:hypothetical protein TWF281_000325 [Arthrobotrys megalospora]